MKKLRDKIIGYCFDIAVELSLFNDMRKFEDNKDKYFSFTELGLGESALCFANNAVYFGERILWHKYRLNPGYANYLSGCVNFISNHSKQLQDKINKTQIFYKFKK